jgi:hypothetical protein
MIVVVGTHPPATSAVIHDDDIHFPLVKKCRVGLSEERGQRAAVCQLSARGRVDGKRSDESLLVIGPNRRFILSRLTFFIEGRHPVRIPFDSY